MRGARGKGRSRGVPGKDPAGSTHGRETQARGKSKVRGARRLTTDITPAAGSEQATKDAPKQSKKNRKRT